MPNLSPADIKLIKHGGKVVHYKKEPCDVYIGRPSKWGNQFAIGKSYMRHEVLAFYLSWVLHEDQKEYREQARKELRGKVLGCWCAPLDCHGDTLLKIADSEEADLKDIWKRGDQRE